MPALPNFHILQSSNELAGNEIELCVNRLFVKSLRANRQIRCDSGLFHV